MLKQIELVRARIMEDFISSGVKELRALLQLNETATDGAATPPAAAAVPADPAAPAWAAMTNATHAFDLAVELLMQHEMDEAENDTSIAQNLVITLELNGTDVQLVTGAHGVLLEAACGWADVKLARHESRATRDVLQVACSSHTHRPHPPPSSLRPLSSNTSRELSKYSHSDSLPLVACVVTSCAN